MIKSWMHDVTLAVQVRSGASPALFVWVAVLALAAFTAFAFLCVAGYDWLAVQLGSIFAALVMAGAFLLIVLLAAIMAAASRRRAKERAILERAARARASSSWLLDPKFLATAVQVGRSLGWERLVPMALLGVLAAQWARQYRDHHHETGT
jgi:hypothetical protein